MLRKKSLFQLLTLGLLVAATAASAQWQIDGSVISAAVYDQMHPTAVADGAGGAIVTWYDLRNGASGKDIYAQRINASGAVQWTANGVAVCTTGQDQDSPNIVSDGAGGAIVTWLDMRSGTNLDVYAQRISASGVVQWAANGVAICNAANDQYAPTIISDGAGGAIVTWYDVRSGNYDIYAQRINPSGAVQWTANGVGVCTTAQNQYFPTLVSDGAGGTIVTWFDDRNGTQDIYAQRLNGSGALQWTATGAPLSNAGGDQYFPTIISDGAGGAIVAWFDSRTDYYDIYAQRVNASGAIKWTVDGVALCTAADEESYPRLVSDGAGGAIVTWHDYRTGMYWDVYAQRVNSGGAVQWPTNGVALCAPGVRYNQDDPTIASDGAGGAIVTWSDSGDIYLQRINAAGVAQWTTDGAPLCTAVTEQAFPMIVADGAGGAIVTWYDYRSGTADIYAQRVDAVYGYWGHPEPIVTAVADITHDQGGKVKVNWTASGRDRPVPATIDYYSIWRAVDVAPFNASASASLAITPLDEVDVDIPLGAHTMTPNSSYYWELVGTQTAYRWPSYSFSAETRADSVAGAAGNEFFMVAAHERNDGHIAFPSNVIGGHSVDNLAPSAPLMLTAQRIGNYVHLKWNGVHVRDLRDYSVYRKTSAGVTPVSLNLLSTATDTLLTDSSPPASALYYIVTAYDVHANQSAPSNEASVQASTGVGNTPSIRELTVLQNYPNPFAGTTELEVGLPASGPIAIEVYDVVGHRVRGIERAGVKGWQRIALSGVGDNGRALASGVYFYKVRAGGDSITRKMLIAR